MTPRQYNEMMRQAEVLEKDDENREMAKLWEQYKLENPCDMNTYVEQYKSFVWLYGMMKQNYKNEE